jgi:hypothetical protein
MSEILFEGSAVGVSFHPALDNLKNAARAGDEDLSLEHVKNNPHDELAVAIKAGGERIGWIPRPHNKKMLHYGFDRLNVEFKHWNTYNDEAVGVSLKVEVVY